MAKEVEKAKVVEIGAMEAAKEGVKEFVKEMYPGLSLSKILGDIVHELKEQWDHGRHELGSTLYTGSAYVQYARKDGKDEPEHGLPEQQKEIGGREL